MNLEKMNGWLESVCGKLNVTPTGIGDDADAFELKEKFLKDNRATFEADKDKCREILQNIDLIGIGKKERSKIGKIKERKTPLLYKIEEGKKIPIGVTDLELDSVDDRTGDITGMKTKDDKILDPRSGAFGDALKDIYKARALIMARSKAMEKEVDKNGNRLFSDRDIEKELWSPLVREGVIPSNLVPTEYSETARVFRNGAAVYTELMEDEEGTEMGGGDGVDKFLGLSKQALKFGKLGVGQALHYIDGGIAEASREQFAGFIKNKTEIKVDENMDELKRLGADVDKLKIEKTEKISALKVTKDRFDLQKEAGGEKDYDKWLAAENTRLTNELEVKGITADQKSALQAKLDAVEAGQLTQKYGESVRHQAMVNCGSAVAVGLIEGTQRYRDRKRSRRDTGEAIIGAVTDAVTAAFTAAQSAEDLTQDKKTKADKHALKFAMLSVKAVARCVNKISQAAYPSNRTDETDKRALIVSALSDMLEGVTEGVAAGFRGDGDARVTGAQTAMTGKAAGILVKAADKIQKAIKERDWKAVAAEMMILSAAAPSAVLAGQMGDVSRKDKDRSEIKSAWDTLDKDAAKGDFAVNPFEETREAEGQDGFGMNGDMATVAAQYAAIDEAGNLLAEIEVDNKKSQTAKKPRTAAAEAALKRCREMAEANKKLAKDPDVKAWLDLHKKGKNGPLEKNYEKIAKAALSKIKQKLDEVEMDGKEHSKVKDDEIIAKLNLAKADKAKLVGDVNELRDLLDHVDSTADDSSDNKAIMAKFKEIRDELFKDERAWVELRDEISEDDEWLEDLKRRADLTRLDKYTDAEEREEEYEKAKKAIETLTKELKKSEMKLKMFDMAMKGATGIVLAAVPGAALLGKIRTLVMDGVKLHKRRTALTIWSNQMKAMRGNYSAYESAVRGEKEVLTAAVVHDSAEVAADVAGVAAETFRLADQTHLGAAVTTSIEKITKCLNGFWYKQYSKNRIKSGWDAFKLAQSEPENRRAARRAMRLNTTLGKCVLAYGACVDKDSQARRAVQACGLTPAVFEDSHDVCQSVVDYLRAKVPDKEFDTIGSHDDINWLPCELEPTVKNWFMIKARATQLNPPMSKQFFRTPDIDEQMKILNDKKAGPQKRYDAAGDLGKLLRKYRPAEANKSENYHAEMIIVAQDLADKVREKQNELYNEKKKAEAAAKVAAKAVAGAAGAAKKGKGNG